MLLGNVSQMDYSMDQLLFAEPHVQHFSGLLHVRLLYNLVGVSDLISIVLFCVLAWVSPSVCTKRKSVVNTVCTVRCWIGNRFKGTSPKVTCMSNGKWSSTDSSCERMTIDIWSKSLLCSGLNVDFVFFIYFRHIF